MKSENALMQGFLKVYVVNTSTGEKTCVSAKKNQITTVHLEVLAALITQKAAVADVTELAFNSMQIEASATPFASGASASDTGPTGTVVKDYVFDRAADVDIDLGGISGLVQFRAEVGTGEANGSTLRAAGIYTVSDGLAGAANELLVCRQVYPAITKTADLAISYVWDVQYSIV